MMGGGVGEKCLKTNNQDAEMQTHDVSGQSKKK